MGFFAQQNGYMIKKPAFAGLALSDVEKSAVADWISSMDRLWTLLSEDVWGKGEVFKQNNADEGALARGLDPFFEEYYNGLVGILHHTSSAGNLEKTLQRCRTAAEGHIETVLREILQNREQMVLGWEDVVRERSAGELPLKAQQIRTRCRILERQFHEARTPNTQVRRFLALLKAY